MNNAGQFIGYIAMAVSVMIYFRRRRKDILIMKLITDVLWAMHHLLILSYTAAMTTSMAIFREIVFYNYDKNWAKSKWWRVGFSALFVAAALFTWKDYFSIVPAVSSVLTTVAFGSKKLSFTRTFAFAASVGMMIYGIHYNSTATVINECMTEFSIIASVFVSRYVKRKDEKIAYK